MSRSSVNKVAAAAFTALKKNWLPGLVLQLFGLTLVLGYYFFQPFRLLLEALAQLKQNGGYLFSAVITAIFGGFIPHIVQMVFEKEHPAAIHLRTGIFIVLFWAYRGVEVDLFYRGQALLFGSNSTFLTILKKTLVDQFLYAPFWSIAVVALGMLFKECRLSFRDFRRQLDRTFITVTYPSIVFSTWVVWIPGVALIYALPLLLQVPMMNLIACFYALLVMYMTRHRRELERMVRPEGG